MFSYPLECWELLRLPSLVSRPHVKPRLAQPPAIPSLSPEPPADWPRTPHFTPYDMVHSVRCSVPHLGQPASPVFPPCLGHHSASLPAAPPLCSLLTSPLPFPGLAGLQPNPQVDALTWLVPDLHRHLLDVCLLSNILLKQSQEQQFT